MATRVNLPATADAKSRGTGPAEPSDIDQNACRTANDDDPAPLHVVPIGVPRQTLPEPSLSRWMSSATHCPFTPFRSTTGKELIGTDFTDGPVVVVTLTVDVELQLLTMSRHTNADANEM